MINKTPFLLFILISANFSDEIFADGPEMMVELNGTNSFHCIKIPKEPSEFYPFILGVVSVVGSKGDLYHPWSPDVKFRLLKTIARSSAEGVMFKDNDSYFHYSVILEKTKSALTIRIKDQGEIDKNTLPKYYAHAFAFYLDRCENAINPVIIAAPYLTMFNILFVNHCFVSIYFDWDRTNDSQLIPYNNKSFSSTSEFYSQCALYYPLNNGIRNRLDETIYLKVSYDF